MACSLNPVKEVLRACNISLVELVAQKIICSLQVFSLSSHPYSVVTTLSATPHHSRSQTAK